MRNPALPAGVEGAGGCHGLRHFRSVSGHLGETALQPIGQSPRPVIGELSDKIEHLVAYALLGLAGGLAFPTRRGAIVLLVLLPKEAP